MFVARGLARHLLSPSESCQPDPCSLEEEQSPPDIFGPRWARRNESLSTNHRAVPICRKGRFTDDGPASPSPSRLGSRPRSRRPRGTLRAGDMGPARLFWNFRAMPHRNQTFSLWCASIGPWPISAIERHRGKPVAEACSRLSNGGNRQEGGGKNTMEGFNRPQRPCTPAAMLLGPGRKWWAAFPAP